MTKALRKAIDITRARVRRARATWRDHPLFPEAAEAELTEALDELTELQDAAVRAKLATRTQDGTFLWRASA